MPQGEQPRAGPRFRLFPVASVRRSTRLRPTATGRPIPPHRARNAAAGVAVRSTGANPAGNPAAAPAAPRAGRARPASPARSAKAARSSRAPEQPVSARTAAQAEPYSPRDDRRRTAACSVRDVTLPPVAGAGRTLRYPACRDRHHDGRRGPSSAGAGQFGTSPRLSERSVQQPGLELDSPLSQSQHTSIDLAARASLSREVRAAFRLVLDMASRLFRAAGRHLLVQPGDNPVTINV